MAQDGLDVLADVEDDRARLDPVDRAGDELALAAGELVEDLVALDLADALEHDLLGGLGADPSEHVAVELLGLDDVAGLGGLVVGLRVVDRDLGQFVLDLLDDEAGAEDADLPGLGVDADLDVLFTGDASIRRLDTVLDGADQLLSGHLLLGIELEEGAHEVSTHDRLLLFIAAKKRPTRKKTWGSPTSRSGRSVARSIHADGWTPQWRRARARGSCGAGAS